MWAGARLASGLADGLQDAQLSTEPWVPKPSVPGGPSGRGPPADSEYHLPPFEDDSLLPNFVDPDLPPPLPRLNAAAEVSPRYAGSRGAKKTAHLCGPRCWSSSCTTWPPDLSGSGPRHLSHAGAAWSAPQRSAVTPGSSRTWVGQVAGADGAASPREPTVGDGGAVHSANYWPDAALPARNGSGRRAFPWPPPPVLPVDDELRARLGALEAERRGMAANQQQLAEAESALQEELQGQLQQLHSEFAVAQMALERHRGHLERRDAEWTCRLRELEAQGAAEAEAQRAAAAQHELAAQRSRAEAAELRAARSAGHGEIASLVAALERAQRSAEERVAELEAEQVASTRSQEALQAQSVTLAWKQEETEARMNMMHQDLEAQKALNTALRREGEALRQQLRDARDEAQRSDTLVLKVREEGAETLWAARKKSETLQVELAEERAWSGSLTDSRSAGTGCDRLATAHFGEDTQWRRDFEASRAHMRWLQSENKFLEAQMPSNGTDVRRTTKTSVDSIAQDGFLRGSTSMPQDFCRKQAVRKTASPDARASAESVPGGEDFNARPPRRTPTFAAAAFARQRGGAGYADVGQTSRQHDEVDVTDATEEPELVPRTPKAPAGWSKCRPSIDVDLTEARDSYQGLGFDGFT